MTPQDPDQAWLDALAGRTVHGEGEDASEARWLREGFRRHAPPAPAGHATAPEVRIQRLLARAREAGLLGAEHPSPVVAGVVAPSRRAKRGAGVGLLSGRRLGVGIGLGLGLALALAWWSLRPAQRPPAVPAEAFVLRSDGVLQRHAADLTQARQARDALLTGLRGQGFQAEPYELLGRPGIDLDLPQPLSPAQAQALQLQGIAPPAGGQLRIEFLPERP